MEIFFCLDLLVIEAWISSSDVSNASSSAKIFSRFFLETFCFLKSLSIFFSCIFIELLTFFLLPCSFAVYSRSSYLILIYNSFILIIKLSRWFCWNDCPDDYPFILRWWNCFLNKYLNDFDAFSLFFHSFFLTQNTSI